MATAYVGSIIHSLSLRDLEFLTYAVLAVSETGHILFFEPVAISEADPDGDTTDTEKAKALLDKHCFHGNVVYLEKGEFLCPGLIDTHTVWLFLVLSMGGADQCWLLIACSSVRKSFVWIRF